MLEPSRPIRLDHPVDQGARRRSSASGWPTDGSVDVPPLTRHNEAGWFDEGPTPGPVRPGADRRARGHPHRPVGLPRPARSCKPGQRDRGACARTARWPIFEVNSVERFGKAKLPDQAGLRRLQPARPAAGHLRRHAGWAARRGYSRQHHRLRLAGATRAGRLTGRSGGLSGARPARAGRASRPSAGPGCGGRAPARPPRSAPPAARAGASRARPASCRPWCGCTGRRRPPRSPRRAGRPGCAGTRGRWSRPGRGSRRSASRRGRRWPGGRGRRGCGTAPARTG